MVFNQPVVNCPNCGQAFSPDIQQVLDIREDPNVVSRLISGRANVVNCPNCGFALQVLTPLVYHDPYKEMLLIHVPMELNMSQDQQEQIVGQYIRRITDSLPMEMRKGYLLNPRRTFTLQGMIDTVMDAEGISKELLNQRQQQLQLVEQFMQTPPDLWQSLAEQHDADLDEQFFSMLTVTAEMMLANGQHQAAQQLIQVRDGILPYTSYGADLMSIAQRQEEVIQAVGMDLNNLGSNVTRQTLAKVAFGYAGKDEHLQVFASMARSAMDYQFFNEMTALIDQAESEELHAAQTQVRERLLELVAIIDEQNQQVIEQSASILESIIAAHNVEEAIRQNLAMIDETFMAVLRAFIAENERQGDDSVRLEKLYQVQQIIADLIMQSSPPEVRFINELLQIEDMLEIRLALVDRAPEFGPRLLQYLDALLHQLEEQGDSPISQRIREIREEARKVIDPSS